MMSPQNRMGRLVGILLRRMNQMENGKPICSMKPTLRQFGFELKS